MADKKISQLSAASTPLAGTEVLPIVQSGSTVQVSVANLTVGRSVTAGALTNLGDVSLGNKSGTNDLTIAGAATASVVTVGRLSSTSGDSTTFNVQNRLGVNVLSVSGAGNGSADVTGTFSVTRGVTLATATGGVAIGSSTDPGTGNLSVSGYGLFGTTTAISGADVTVNKVFATSTFIGINSSTATTVASGVSFLAVVRCRGSGGSAVILYENNTTPVIIAQTGSVTFTTSAPTANQIQIADGGSSITAKSGSSVGTNNLNISVLQNQ